MKNKEPKQSYQHFIMLNKETSERVKLKLPEPVSFTKMCNLIAVAMEEQGHQFPLPPEPKWVIDKAWTA